MADLSVTLIQSDLRWENTAANLESLEKQIDALPEDTELILLPEMFTTGFSMRAVALAGTMEGEAVRWMKRKAREKRAALAGSLIISDHGHYFNRLLWVLPNGRTAAYDKRHLFSYADEHLHYSPGDKRLIARLKGWKIALTICYDLRFPVWLRQPVDPASRYDLLVCVANWPESRAGAWNTLLRARAIENQCYVAGVNRIGTDGHGIAYGGDSCLIDPLGEVLTIRHGQQATLTQRLSRTHLEEVRRRFPFLADADGYVLKKNN